MTMPGVAMPWLVGYYGVFQAGHVVVNVLYLSGLRPTFPAFICPEKFPMVDVQVAKWARTSGRLHVSSNYGCQLLCPPDLTPGQVVKEGHWPFVESWIGWCRSTACELSRRTNFAWRARDVEWQSTRHRGVGSR